MTGGTLRAPPGPPLAHPARGCVEDPRRAALLIAAARRRGSTGQRALVGEAI